MVRLAHDVVCVMVFAVCSAPDAGAAEAAAPPTEAPATEHSVRTRHAITIDGTQLAYTATAGTLRVRLEKSAAEAVVFYVGYDKDGADPTRRPITFVFNGGPGSSAAWLHIAALGPRP